MKVTDLRRKLAASLVAGGLMAPGAAYAQSLNTNLLTNPSFENVGTTTCCYGAVEILDWTDGTRTGFAYTYGHYYDAGGPLAGGGEYYFTPNGDGDTFIDITQPGEVSQNVDVSTGAVATQIAAGEAAVKLSAFFTAYPFEFDELDLGNLHVEFLTAGGDSLGTSLITAKPRVTTWQQQTRAEFIPVGTATLRASVFGTSGYFGPDGYTDLVDVQVSQAVNELLFIEVNTIDGQIAIKNQTGDPIHLDYYEISVPGPAGDYNANGVADAADYTVWRDLLGTDTVLPNDSTPGVTADDYTVWVNNFGAAVNSLDADGWLGIQEQTLDGFPAGNGSGNGWEQAGGSNGRIISESFLIDNSELVHNGTVPLGPAFVVGSPHTLEFRYGLVSDDGLGGFDGPGDLIRGFVRYVGAVEGAASATGVPEPASVWLVSAGLVSLAVGGRRSPRGPAS